MKKILFLVCLCTQSFLLHSQSNCGGDESYAELNINNIRAGVLQSGSLWWNASEGRYFAPNDSSGVTAIFAGGLWMGGITPDSTVRLAASRFGHGGASSYDYFPGPLHPETGEAYLNGCEDWNKHFIIYHYEKNAHQTDYNNDNEINNPIASIFGWPGRNNPYFAEYNGFDLPENIDLAPFVDLNGDGTYDPAAGDYPDTKGDQAIWWIFNDSASIHTQSDGEAIGMEIQAMAYAFQSFEEEVNNTTFYDFKLTYRGAEILTDFTVGIWTDVDLGCFADDYIGFNEERDMAFYYNADAVDGDVGSFCGSFETYGEEVPMLGIKLMSDSDDLGVTSFTFNNGGNSDGPGAETSPNTTIEYYRYMNGLWRDGSPFTYGGNGYGGDIPTPYAFPGDPSDADDWSMCTAASSNNPEYDPKTIMATGGSLLNSGDTKEYSYAVIFVPDVPHPCPSLDMLNAAADAIADFDCVVSGISEPNFAQEIGLEISPNPASQKFTVSVESENILLNSVEIIDIAGNILQQKHKVDTRNLAFDINDLAVGMYFVKVTTDEGKIAVRKLVVQ